MYYLDLFKDMKRVCPSIAWDKTFLPKLLFFNGKFYMREYVADKRAGFFETTPFIVSGEEFHAASDAASD